jgi:hypothetical protein
VSPLLRLVRHISGPDLDPKPLAMRIASQIEEQHRERVRILRSIARHQRREIARLRAELRARR